MVVKLPKEAFFSTRDPANFYKGMLEDAQILWDAPSYTSCMTLLVCFIDALAAGGGGADKSKFRPFLEQHFGVLCQELEAAVPGKPGAITFYEEFRNGLAHMRGPRSGFALARNEETSGKYIEVFDVEGRGQYVGVNVDRLYSDFVAVVKKCRDGTT